MGGCSRTLRSFENKLVRRLESRAKWGNLSDGRLELLLQAAQLDVQRLVVHGNIAGFDVLRLQLMRANESRETYLPETHGYPLCL